MLSGRKQRFLSGWNCQYWRPCGGAFSLPVTLREHYRESEVHFLFQHLWVLSRQPHKVLPLERQDFAFVLPCFSFSRLSDLFNIFTDFSHIKNGSGDFPGGQVVKTLPSSVEGVALIPGGGARIPHASWPKNQNCNTVANSIKTF